MKIMPIAAAANNMTLSDKRKEDVVLAKKGQGPVKPKNAILPGAAGIGRISIFV